jgi:hypothetical protein
MYRAVHGRVGDEKSRHLFDLYGPLCSASAVRNKRFEDLKRTWGALWVERILADDRQTVRDLLDVMEYWPPSEAAKGEVRVVSPTDPARGLSLSR